MSLNVIFMGTPKFSIPALEELIKSNFNIVAVYTQPPKKSKRGQKINPSPIEEFSKKKELNFRNPSNLNNNEELKIFKELSPDIVVVVAYGQIIPENFLKISKLSFINIHASLLPKWRGAAPIQRAVMNLDKKTGISIMKIVEKLDAGPICNMYSIDINNNENVENISEKLSTLAAEKILDNIEDILEDKVEFEEQKHKEATYANKIEKVEGKIDWDHSAEMIIGKINGLYPNPGAWFVYRGERYKVLKAKISTGSSKPGTIISDKLEVSCNYNKSIKILEIQRQGKKPQNINEFMLGSQIKKGTNLKNA